MSSAALYPVPDPEPDDEAAGERRMPAAVPVAPVPGEPERDEYADDEDQDDQEDEEPERLRAFAIPELRPYADVRDLKELAPYVVAAARGGGRLLLRGITRAVFGVAKAGRGVGVGVLFPLRGARLLVHWLYAWVTGSVGKGGSPLARLGIATAVGYVLATAPAQHPVLPYSMTAALLLLLVFAGSGGIPVPGEKKTKGKKSGEQSKEGQAPEGPPAATAAVVKKGPNGTARGGLLGRLRRRGRAREETPAIDLTKTSADSSPEGPREASTEAPADPSREDVIRALHHHVGDASGTLLTTLAKELSLPDTRAVRRVLGEHCIRVRDGVRAVERNGPGVHRSDFPALSPLPEPGQGPGVVAGESANTNANNTANAPEKGSDVSSNYWTQEEIAQGFRVVKDADRGPSAWKVEHHEGT
ncbi:hypothetical protein [Streptomyces sp. BH104]|uniref:hypothetical protein n=1 Tax=Streptomyces sp. BH104 TaxID=3410407 RepID=UPI003BB60AE7